MSYRLQNQKYFLFASVLFCTIVYFVYVYTSYTRPLYIHTKIKGTTNSTSISITQNKDKWENALIRIAFWVPEYNRPSDRALERMQTVVNHWNSYKGQQCKVGDTDISRHCKFKLTTKHHTASEADAVVFYMFNLGYRL